MALIILGVMGVACASLAPKPEALKNWPAGATPQEVGKRVANNFIPRKLVAERPKGGTVIYPEVCAWYGALTFAQLTGDTAMQKQLIDKFEPFFTEPGRKMLPKRQHVDDSMFGSLPLELYIQTKDKNYLEIGQRYADRQWAKPDANGLSGETRFWIDDMYMITILQVQAACATGDAKYLDRAALEMAAYLDKLQQPNGLFFHAPDVPFYWGRGNGWVAVGMAEVLRSIPADHPKRARIMAGYKKMMAALLKAQGPDGMWRQLIDHPESWPETSSTGMFTFAMITGVKNGWLDEKTYGEAARKGWLGLVKYIDKNANVTSVCEGTNKKNDYQYYMNRKRNTGDFHGQAPVLWCASALLR
jgi:rhamnogalacturonyl hydrolase YesR